MERSGGLLTLDKSLSNNPEIGDVNARAWPIEDTESVTSIVSSRSSYLRSQIVARHLPVQHGDEGFCVDCEGPRVGSDSNQGNEVCAAVESDSNHFCSMHAAKTDPRLMLIHFGA